MADRPIVGIVMGSDSDLETMKRCMKQLDEFALPWEARVISAHRTPEVAHEYASTAADRGLKVIIAAAGMSAALAGVMAANTTLPVVGVPMDGSLMGLDAMLSTLQMPPGIPVGAMAIGKAGATNAAIFAAQIIAQGDPAMAEKIAAFKQQQVDKTVAKDNKLQDELS
jgi:phosphoribosylaminoimidazole carboxylase PurE protein